MIQASSHDDLPCQSEVLDSKSILGSQSEPGRSGSAESHNVTSCREGQPQSFHQVPTKFSSISTSHLNLMQSKQDLSSSVMGDDTRQKDGKQQSPFHSSSRSVSPPSIRVPASHRLRAEISEKDLFATFNFMDDDTDFEEDFRADRSNSLDDTSSTTSGSGDSFGVESLQELKCHDATPEPSINANSNNKLANFLEGDKNVARSTSRGGRDNKNGLVDNVPGEEEDGRSMSIMSINSLPDATMEERSEDDEQFDDDHDGTNGDRNMHRPMRSLASSAVMSTPAAFFALLEEHEKLLEQNDELQEVQARRKAEKNQLHKVLVSKEEEYVERRDRVEWLQSRLDFLEVELMKERANSNCSNSRAMNPLRSKQKAGWEALDSEVSRLDLLRSENKRLVYKLQEQPEVTQADVKMEMRLQRRRKKIMQLEILEAKLKEDVEILRGVDKACKDYDGPV